MRVYHIVLIGAVLIVIGVLGLLAYIAVYPQGEEVSSSEYNSRFGFRAGSTDGAPDIMFVAPTPANDTTQAEDYIYVNVSSTDVSHQYTFTNFDDEIVTLWRMDEVDGGGDILDFFGNHNLTPSGVSISPEAAFGNASYFSNPDFAQSDINFSDFDEMTVAIWVNTTNNGNTATSRHIIWCTGNETGNGGGVEPEIHLNFGVVTALSRPALQFYAKTQTGFVNIIHDLAVGELQNEWHHVAVKMTGMQTSEPFFELYLDGVMVGEGTGPDAILYNGINFNLRLGKCGQNTRFYEGGIDEFLVINKSISQTELDALINSTATQYQNNFTNLEEGLHVFNSYSIDALGQLNQTGDWHVTIGEAPANTCQTFNTTGILDCSDDCVFPNNITLDKNITISGAGTATFHACPKLNQTNLHVAVEIIDSCRIVMKIEGECFT